MKSSRRFLGLVSIFSLPQSILLWMEPDLEPETAAAGNARFSRTGAHS